MCLHFPHTEPVQALSHIVLIDYFFTLFLHLQVVLPISDLFFLRFSIYILWKFLIFMRAIYLVQLFIPHLVALIVLVEVNKP
jgi:hypothetical protein